MDLPSVANVKRDHPCPRQRHHPGERCHCASRLSVTVPHGYSAAADRGDFHACRLQNLRRRLAVMPTRSQEEELPLSLRCLAQDHLGDATVISLRPLASPRFGGKACLTEVRTPKNLKRRCMGSREVSFNDLVAEVPHFSHSRSPLPHAPDRAPVVLDGLKVNRNMARLLENHNQVMSFSSGCACGCFAFLFASSRQHSKPDTGTSVPLAAGRDVMEAGMRLPPNARGLFERRAKVRSPPGSPLMHWSAATRAAAAEARAKEEYQRVVVERAKPAEAAAQDASSRCVGDEAQIPQFFCAVTVFN